MAERDITVVALDIKYKDLEPWEVTPLDLYRYLQILTTPDP